KDQSTTIKMLLGVLTGQLVGYLDRDQSKAMIVASQHLRCLCERNVIENKQLLADAVRYYVYKGKAIGYPPEIRFNILGCINALTDKDNESKGSNGISKSERCILVKTLLDAEISRIQSSDGDKTASLNLIKI